MGTARLAAAGLAMIAVCYGLARFAYGLPCRFGVEFGLDAAAAGAIASSSDAGYCVAIVVATLATAAFLLIAMGQALAAPVIVLLSDLVTAPLAFCTAALASVLGTILRPTA